MRNKTCSKDKFRPYNEVTAKACEDARNGKIGLSIAIVCEVLAISPPRSIHGITRN